MSHRIFDNLNILKKSVQLGYGFYGSWGPTGLAADVRPLSAGDQIGQYLFEIAGNVKEKVKSTTM